MKMVTGDLSARGGVSEETLADVEIFLRRLETEHGGSLVCGNPTEFSSAVARALVRHEVANNGRHTKVTWEEDHDRGAAVVNALMGSKIVAEYFTLDKKKGGGRPIGLTLPAESAKEEDSGLSEIETEVAALEQEVLTAEEELGELAEALGMDDITMDPFDIPENTDPWTKRGLLKARLAKIQENLYPARELAKELGIDTLESEAVNTGAGDYVEVV